MTGNRKPKLVRIVALSMFLGSVFTQGASLAGTAVEVTVGGAPSSFDYDSTRPYLSYIENYASDGYYSDGSITLGTAGVLQGVADAASQSLGASTAFRGTEPDAGGLGMLFDARIQLEGTTSSYPGTIDPVDLRVQLRLSGSLTNGSLLQQAGTIASNNDGMMRAAYLVYQSAAPLDLSTFWGLTHLAESIRTDSLPPEIVPLASFYGEASAFRESMSSTEERYLYFWDWMASGGNDGGSDWGEETPPVSPMSDADITRSFDTGLIELVLNVVPVESIWVTGVLWTSANVNGGGLNSAEVDFTGGFTSSISSLKPGVTVSVVPNVAVVPLPPAVWLFVSGALCLMKISRRQVA